LTTNPWLTIDNSTKLKELMEMVITLGHFNRHFLYLLQGLQYHPATRQFPFKQPVYQDTSQNAHTHSFVLISVRWYGYITKMYSSQYYEYLMKSDFVQTSDCKVQW